MADERKSGVGGSHLLSFTTPHKPHRRGAGCREGCEELIGSTMDSSALKDLLATLRSTQSGTDGDASLAELRRSDLPRRPDASDGRGARPTSSAAESSSNAPISNQELSALLGSLQPVRPPQYAGPSSYGASRTYSPYSGSPSLPYVDAGPAPPLKRRLSTEAYSDTGGGPSSRRGSSDAIPTIANKARKRDLTQMTYAQALPILSRLINDRAFIEAVSSMKEEQDTLELSIVDDRNRTRTEGQRAIKASEKAGKPAEAQRHRRDLVSTLATFDKAALARWDTLREKQQKSMRELGVPTFQVSKDTHILQRQRQVLKVIMTALDDGGGEDPCEGEDDGEHQMDAC